MFCGNRILDNVVPAILSRCSCTLEGIAEPIRLSSIFIWMHEMRFATFVGAGCIGGLDLLGGLEAAEIY